VPQARAKSAFLGQEPVRVALRRPPVRRSASMISLPAQVVSAGWFGQVHGLFRGRDERRFGCLREPPDRRYVELAAASA